MNKVISNFYLIKVGGKPSYIGYTNRSIKARFKEHLRDKDFGDELVELESLGNLAYDFTWDLVLINKYSREVSDRETELILIYGTKDSTWQKGLGSNLGGQTWSSVKNFVKTNRDNPKFRDLFEENIVSYLETSNKVYRYMKSFVAHIDDPVNIYMKGFVHGMNDPVSSYMQHFVSHMDDPASIYMKSFVATMNDPVAIYMKNFVNRMDDSVSIYMKHFVSSMDYPVLSYMKHFVGGMNDPVSLYMGHFVSSMDDPVSSYLKNFTGHMNKPVEN